MRYGSCKSHAPPLLAGGVVAGPQGCPLVASSRLADALSPLHRSAPVRAETLPAVTAGADDHQPAAPPAGEHPVALLDGRAPATEDWTEVPPPAILTASVESSLRRWHRSPGRLVNPLQAWASSSRWGLRSTAPVEARSRNRPSRRRPRTGVLLPARQPSAATHWRARTKSTTCASREPDPGHAPAGNQIHSVATKRRRESDPGCAAPTGQNQIHRSRAENQISPATAQTARKARIQTAANRAWP